MKRIAACQCSGFRVVVVGDPTVVNICHCTECHDVPGLLLCPTLISATPTFIWKASTKSIRASQSGAQSQARRGDRVLLCAKRSFPSASDADKNQHA
jgi:hypothetical protein